MSAVITVVEITITNERVKINEKNEVEREIMTCLSKIFSLTNDNSRMKDEFTSKNDYLAVKGGAEDIPKGSIQDKIQCDKKSKEFLEIVALQEMKDIYHQKYRNKILQIIEKKAKKRTSSSILGLYFGHHKSVAESKISTKLHAMFLNTTITT